MLTAEPLKLIAFDEDDLAVISTHLQDAQVRPADIAYLPRERRFALVLDRFDWCSAETGAFIRRRAGLHFERVLGVRHAGFARDGEMPATLVAMAFEAGDLPAGTIVLGFADGSAIRLSVECLEAAMADLGEAWACDKAPAANA